MLDMAKCPADVTDEVQLCLQKGFSALLPTLHARHSGSRLNLTGFLNGRVWSPPFPAASFLLSLAEQVSELTLQDVHFIICRKLLTNTGRKSPPNSNVIRCARVKKAAKLLSGHSPGQMKASQRVNLMLIFRSLDEPSVISTLVPLTADSEETASAPDTKAGKTMLLLS